MSNLAANFVVTIWRVHNDELKRDESADKALQQIEDKSYVLPFVADDRKIYKIGVSFDSGQRILADWKVKEE